MKVFPDMVLLGMRNLWIWIGRELITWIWVSINSTCIDQNANNINQHLSKRNAKNTVQTTISSSYDLTKSSKINKIDNKVSVHEPEISNQVRYSEDNLIFEGINREKNIYNKRVSSDDIISSQMQSQPRYSSKINLNENNILNNKSQNLKNTSINKRL